MLCKAAALLPIFLHAAFGLRLVPEPLPYVGPSSNEPDTDKLISSWNLRIKKNLPKLMRAFEGTDYDTFIDHHEAFPTMDARQRRLKAQAEPAWLIENLKGLHDDGSDPDSFWRVWYEASNRLRMVQLGLDADTLKLSDIEPVEEMSNRYQIVQPDPEWRPNLEGIRSLPRPSALKQDQESTKRKKKSPKFDWPGLKPEIVSGADARTQKNAVDLNNSTTSGSCSSVGAGASLHPGSTFQGPGNFVRYGSTYSRLLQDEIIEFAGEPGYNCYMDTQGNLCNWLKDLQTTELYAWDMGSSGTPEHPRVMKDYDTRTPMERGLCCYMQTPEAVGGPNAVYGLRPRPGNAHRPLKDQFAHSCALDYRESQSLPNWGLQDTDINYFTLNKADCLRASQGVGSGKSGSGHHWEAFHYTHYKCVDWGANDWRNQPYRNGEPMAPLMWADPELLGHEMSEVWNSHRNYNFYRTGGAPYCKGAHFLRPMADASHWACEGDSAHRIEFYEVRGCVTPGGYWIQGLEHIDYMTQQVRWNAGDGSGYDPHVPAQRICDRLGSKCGGVVMEELAPLAGAFGTIKLVEVRGASGATCINLFVFNAEVQNAHSIGDRQSCTTSTCCVDANRHDTVGNYWKWSLADADLSECETHIGLRIRVSCVNDYAHFNFGFGWYHGEVFDGRDSSHPYLSCVFVWLAYFHINLEMAKTGSDNAGDMMFPTARAYETRQNDVTFYRDVGWENGILPKYYQWSVSYNATSNAMVMDTPSGEDDYPMDTWMEGWDCFGPFNTDILNLAAFSTGDEPIATAGAMMLVSMYKAYFGETNLTDYDEVKVKCQNKCDDYYAPGCWMQRAGLLFCESAQGTSNCAQSAQLLPWTGLLQRLKWTWICGLCDPPMFYSNVKDYIFQRRRKEELPYWKWGLPTPWSGHYFVLVHGPSNDQLAWKNWPSPGGNFTWWKPDAYCMNFNRKDNTTLAPASEERLWIRLLTTFMRYHEGAEEDWGSEKVEKDYAYFTQTEADGLTLFEKHMAEYMAYRWECLNSCMNLTYKGLNAGSKLGCELKMSIHKGENLPAVKWPVRRGGSNIGLSCDKTTNAALGFSASDPNRYFKNSVGEGWYMMSLDEEAIEYTTTDSELSDRVGGAGDPMLTKDSQGTPITVKDRIVKNTRVEGSDTQAIVDMVQTFNQKFKKDSPYQVITAANCQDALMQHRDYLTEKTSVHRRRTRSHAPTIAAGTTSFAWRRTDQEQVFYYTLTCSHCKKGISAINSTKVAIELAEHEYRIGERDLSRDDVVFKAKKANGFRGVWDWANEGGSKTKGAHETWTGDAFYFGVNTKQAWQKWEKYTAKNTLLEVATETGSSFTQLAYRGRTFDFKVTATMASLTKDNYEKVNMGNWSCVGKVNAIVTIYYSTVQSATEVNSGPKGTEYRPVCGDSGGSLADLGIMARATDVAMNNAMRKIGGNKRMRLRAEWQTTAKDTTKALTEAMGYVPSSKASSSSEKNRAHRRRRSNHRRRRSHRRRTQPKKSETKYKKEHYK